MIFHKKFQKLSFLVYANASVSFTESLDPFLKRKVNYALVLSSSFTRLKEIIDVSEIIRLRDKNDSADMTINQHDMIQVKATIFQTRNEQSFTKITFFIS